MWNKPAVITITVYLLTILLISPWGNYSAVDDFYFFLQTKAFSQGILIKSALIDPSFILQGLLGMVWVSIFGLSFNALRVLTLIFSVICLLGIYKILLLYKVSGKLVVLTLLTTAFNPYFYFLSLTYMTEIYFLTFAIWALYFLTGYLIRERDSDILWAGVLGGLSVMVRQFGIVLLPAIFLAILYRRRTQVKYRDPALVLTVFLVLSFIGISWPKYETLLQPQSLNPLKLLNFNALINRTILNWKILPYIGFCLAPLSGAILLDKNKRFISTALLISSVLSYYVYSQNVFGLENTFYLEGYGAKSYITLRESLFNNQTFKLFLSFFCSLSAVTLILYLISDGKRWLKRASLSITGLVAVMFFLIPAFTNHLYDRYYLNFLVVLLIFVCVLVNDVKVRHYVFPYSILLFISLIVMFLTVDYTGDNKVKWQIAGDLVRAGHSATDIFLNDSYIKYSNLVNLNDLSGTQPAMPADPHFKCFVQNYSKTSHNFISKTLNFSDTLISGLRIFPPTTVKEYGYSKPMSGRCGDRCRIFEERGYVSPMYDLVGKRIFVRAFCVENT